VTFKATAQGLKISDALLNQEVQTMDDWSQLDNGQWVMKGRMDDLINTGGVKVYPTQVEEIIDRFVDFESFVKASPDDTLGEVITWVVPMEAIIPENWKLWFEQYPILQPRKIERVEELPRNRNGKWKRK
jgi:O-succinylbenzoic acid--CoA ligase